MQWQQTSVAHITGTSRKITHLKRFLGAQLIVILKGAVRVSGFIREFVGRT